MPGIIEKSKMIKDKFLLIGLLILLFWGCIFPLEAIMIREPAVAGQFYPGDKKTLSSTIDSFFAEIPAQILPGKIIGIAVPHAGYPFSGPTATYAYKSVAKENIQTIIMIGPTHHAYFEGIAVYGEGSWKTPLGDVPVDETLAQSIIKQNPIIHNLPEAHSEEHSLEVQVPFLQKIFKNFKIVPIMLFEPTYEECQMLAQAIVINVKNKKVLLLASSDLYHGNSYDSCNMTDKITLSYIEKFDPKGLYQALKQDKAQACGGFPIVTVMLAAKLLGADKGKVLHHTNSNDVINERGGYCVGYSASVFYQTDTNTETGAKSNDKDIINLTMQEKNELLRISRTTIENHVAGKKIPAFIPLTEKLNEEYGVFVTLKKKGELRGCIGYIQGIEPLYKAVSDMAVAASTEDPRFTPVTTSELKNITIEITVMTPLRKISDINEIKVGKHGLVIKNGYNQGLLLPQVATEEGWNRQTFLEKTCWKAGLPDDAWKEKNTEIYIFSGTVFGEQHE